MGRTIKVFDVQKGGDDINEINISSVGTGKLEKVKTIGEYKSGEGVVALQELLQTFGIESNRMHIKNLANALHETRNVIKRSQSDLLDILDDESFKFGAVPYLIMLFHLEPNIGWSKEGKNSVQNLVAFLLKILQNDSTIEITSFLCAHRESGTQKPERKNYLAEKVNTVTFSRIQNIIRGFFENIAKDYKVQFLQPGGDEYGMNAVFPTIFQNYLSGGVLEGMLTGLDKHLADLSSQCKTEKFSVTSTFEHAKNVEDTLIDRYGSERSNMNAYSIAEKDKFVEVAYHITRDDMLRVLSSQKTLDRPSIDTITKLNIASTLDANNKEIIENAIHRYVNKFSMDAKALYETMFYYLRGQKTQGKDKIAMGFDRDHDLYQSTSFGLGYHNRVDATEGVPLLYARRKDLVNTSDLDKLSLRQFWYHDGMYE